MKRGRADPALAPQFPGHDDGLLHRETRRAVVADGLRRRQRQPLLLALLDAPGWREDMPRLVRGTLGRMQRGRWNTTVANAWGVLALDKFSAPFESDAGHRHDDARRSASERFDARVAARRRRRSVRDERLAWPPARDDARRSRRRHRRAVGHAAEHRRDAAQGAAVERLSRSRARHAGPAEDAGQLDARRRRARARSRSRRSPT